MLQVNLPIVDTVHSKGNKFVTGVKIKATGDSELNDNPEPQNNIIAFTTVGNVNIDKKA